MEKMIISTCPLRISLFGGSSDSPEFISKYGFGQAISFTCNLKTYVMMSEDKLGFNKYERKYILNYSKHEETELISDVQNELIRVVLDYFNLPPVTIYLNSDVYSQGSGLASSSSYLISLIKSVCLFTGKYMTDIEICKLAHELELKFNPHCGYQDPYGCGIGGFKHLKFYSNDRVDTEFLDIDLFRNYDASLIYTGITRNSKNILKDVTSNSEKVLPLVKIVDEASDAIKKKDYPTVFSLLQESWQKKKKTSTLIIDNKDIATIDNVLSKNKSVLAHKLCGAGNGGFFLVFSEKNQLSVPYHHIKIDISHNGVEGEII